MPSLPPSSARDRQALLMQSTRRYVVALLPGNVTQAREGVGNAQFGSQLAKEG